MDGGGRGWRRPAEAQREGGQRKQLGRARWRWGRKERRTSILFKLPGEANTNKQRWTANGKREGERKAGPDPGQAERAMSLHAAAGPAV